MYCQQRTRPFSQASAHIDDRIAEAGASYLRTASIWCTDDDVRDESDAVAAAHTTSALDPVNTNETPMIAIDPSLFEADVDYLDTFSGDENAYHETNIFSGEEGHELFIRLLMEADDESILPPLDSITA